MICLYVEALAEGKPFSAFSYEWVWIWQNWGTWKFNFQLKVYENGKNGKWYTKVGPQGGASLFWHLYGSTPSSRSKFFCCNLVTEVIQSLSLNLTLLCIWSITTNAMDQPDLEANICNRLPAWLRHVSGFGVRNTPAGFNFMQYVAGTRFSPQQNLFFAKSGLSHKENCICTKCLLQHQHY